MIIIPARYGSTRFPGKPFAMIAGKTLLERVIRLAEAAVGKECVTVATDDARIIEAVAGIGHKAVMTSPDCTNGSERVYEVINSLEHKPGVIINLQGDSPLLPPWIISELISAMEQNPEIAIATPAVKLSGEQYEQVRSEKAKGSSSGTTVTFDRNGDALYFSKALIPYVRKKSDSCPVYKHIGLYAYTPQSLEKYVSLPQGVFEEAEQLEQLRALENGIPIKVVLADLKGRTLWSVDNPEDVQIVEQIIAKEGELAS